MRFASWNINSINIRVDQLLEWIKKNKIDVICLQEIKSSNENFPFNKLKSENLNIEFVGQKSYNGVAILSIKPIKLRRNALPSG